MKNPLKYLIFILLHSYINIGYSSNEISLRATQCLVLFSGKEIKMSLGSLPSSVCTLQNKLIVCSDTFQDGGLVNGKPTTINTYKILNFGNIVVWEAENYEGQVILNILEKKYTSITIHIGDKGIFNKHCIGDILEYPY